MRALSATEEAAAIAGEAMLALLLLRYGRARVPPPFPMEKEEVIGRTPALVQAETLDA